MQTLTHPLTLRVALLQCAFVCVSVCVCVGVCTSVCVCSWALGVCVCVLLSDGLNSADVFIYVTVEKCYRRSVYWGFTAGLTSFQLVCCFLGFLDQGFSNGGGGLGG